MAATSSALSRAMMLWRSRSVRASAENAAYSILEYISQPLTIVLAAPYLVAKLGLEQFGLWMLTMAVLGSTGMMSTGFGDSTIKYASSYRGRDDMAGVLRTVRSALALNAILGAAFGSLVAVFAPLAVHQVFKIEAHLQPAAVLAFRLAAAILFLRSIEVVFVNTARAFEQYVPTVRVSVATRVAAILAAVILVSLGFGVVAIMGAILASTVAGVPLQAVNARRVIGSFFLPNLRADTIREILGFGGYSWLQAVAALIFTHADRLLIGGLLGMSGVAYYSICVQAAQPVHGLAAAAFHFMFPHLSARSEERARRRAYRLALAANIIVAAALSLPLVLFARPILSFWMGSAFAEQAHALLAILAFGFALLALTVVPHYALLASGEVRFVSIVNVLGGTLSLGAAVLLVPLLGIVGAAVARILYGVAVTLNFLKVRRVLVQQA